MIDLRDKTIAVVGNAQSLLQHTHGQEIERHDIVIRMNRGLPRMPDAQGVRTDVLAFSILQVVADILEQFNARAAIWMSPKYRAGAKGRFEFYELERWHALRAKLGARPSVGAMILDYVGSKSVGGVSMFGYDFKRSLTIGYDQQYLGPHDFRAEEEYCAGMANRSGWRLVKDDA
jgi:hypothetical protein